MSTPAPISADLAAAYRHVAEFVGATDRDRYLATLFAPAAKRPHLFALYAFSAEIGRVRDHVSSPMPGEIRLQWWRDVLAGDARGDVGGNPVAAAILDTIARFRLPVPALLDLIDARVFDLYDDPMPSVHDLEGYLGETSSALVRLGSLVLADGQDPGGAEAAGHAGLAYGLTGLLRALPWLARAGRLYLPFDVLSRHGVTRDDVVRGRGGPGLRSSLAELRAVASGHLARVTALRGTIPKAIRPAFLPAALVPRDLALLGRPGQDPLQPCPDDPAWRRILALWRANLRGV